MLLLDKPRQIAGLRLFGDSEDDNLWYYVPTRPRLSVSPEGIPEFVFLKYKRDITDNPDFDPATKSSLGGGFLAFTVDLGVDQDLLDHVKSVVGGELVPITFRKGTVSLSMAKAEPAQPDGPTTTKQTGLRFVDEVWGSTKPAILGDCRATFGLALSHEAAELIEAGLRSGTCPVGVLYEVEFLAMRPAFDVRIRADYERIFTELDIQFGVKAEYMSIAAAVEVDLAFQRLRDEGHISVEVKHFGDDADLRKQADEAFTYFKTELIKDFFKTSLTPPSFMTKEAGSGGILGSLDKVLGGLGKSEDGSSTPPRGAPTTEAPTTPPAKTGADAAATASQTTQTGPPATNGGAGASGTSGGGGVAGFGAQVGFSLKYLDQQERKIREFDYSVQAAVSWTDAPNGLFSTIVDGLDLDRAIQHVNLDSDFFRRLVATVNVVDVFEDDGVAAVTVNLEYPGDRVAGTPAEHVDGTTFMAGALEPHTFTTWLNDAKDMAYRYKMDVFFAPDSGWRGDTNHYETDWIEATERALTLDPFDAVDRLDLTVAMAKVDPKEIAEIHVDLTYDDEASGFSAADTFVLTPGGVTSARWQLRLPESGARQYRHRTTWHFTNGLRYSSDWKESGPLSIDQSTLVVGAPFLGRLAPRLVPLIDMSDVIDASVDFDYWEEESNYHRQVSVSLAPAPGSTTGLAAKQTVEIPTIVAEPAGCTYSVTVVRSDGSVYESGELDLPGDQKTIAVSDGVGVTRNVTVMLPSGTKLASNGLSAVRVRLTGLDEHHDQDDALFTSSGEAAAQLVSIVQSTPQDAFRYAYEVTGYTLQGVPVDGMSGQAADTRLVVPLPVGTR